MQDHWITKRFSVVDAKDIDGFLAMISEDHQLLFGGRPPVVGKTAAREQVLAFWAAIDSVKHNLQKIYEQDNTVIVESVVEYGRLDGKKVSVPCCDVFTIRDGLIAETRAYLDQAPVWQ